MVTFMYFCELNFHDQSLDALSRHDWLTSDLSIEEIMFVIEKIVESSIIICNSDQSYIILTIVEMNVIWSVWIFAHF